MRESIEVPQIARLGEELGGMKTHAPIPDALAVRLVERLAKADCMPADLASELEIPLATLGRWALEPGNIGALCGLAKLADIRAQMVVSSFRASIAVRLIRMATYGEPDELARKACVDLLRTDLGAFAPGAEEYEAAGSGTEQIGEAALLRTLERLGSGAGGDPDLCCESGFEMALGAEKRSACQAQENKG